MALTKRVPRVAVAPGGVCSAVPHKPKEPGGAHQTKQVAVVWGRVCSAVPHEPKHPVDASCEPGLFEQQALPHTTADNKGS